MTPEEVTSRLDLEHIAAAAQWAADEIQMNDRGVAVLDLTPGDMTRYEIIVIPPGRRFGERGDAREWIVTLGNCDGLTYPWMGHDGMHHEYVGSKWLAKPSLWTAVVLTEFLNALAKAMKS